MSNVSDIEFLPRIRVAFSFLIDIGFIEKESSPKVAKFQNSDVQVVIYFGQSSYEIHVIFIFEDKEFSLGEILSAKNERLREKFRYPAATTSEEVEKALLKLSQLCKDYCEEALRGDPQFYKSLEINRKIWSQDYELEVLCEQLRPEAEDAFRNHNYTKAVELYSRIRKALTPSEQKKLSIAERKLHD